MGQQRSELAAPACQNELDDHDLLVIAEECERIGSIQGVSAARKLAESHTHLGRLRSALRCKSGVVRRKVMYLLCIHEPEQVLGDIALVLANDPCPVVRHEAAFFLGALKLHGAVTHLEKALLNDEEEIVRHEAAEALGDLGDIDALPALERALQDHSFVVRRTVEMAIEQLRPATLQQNL
jgi:HEAT repeat protein